MGAHIYQRVGRYADAAAANSAAVGVDQAYFAKTTPPGYYAMYLGHNYGFLAFSASMQGRGADSIEASRGVVKVVPAELIESIPGGDFFIAEPLLVLVRFGRWDDLLVEPRPPAKYPVMTGMWLHSHGMALAAKGRPDEAARDLAELDKLRAGLPPDATAGLNSARDVMAVAAKVLEARIAQARHSPNTLALWEQAVKLEDALAYSEPADWFYPVRHYQGAALLAAKQYKSAEAVFREDLRRNPGNGWALFGLSEALKHEKRSKEAAAARKQFDEAWKAADVKLASSAI
jgi:tetratricopeptide (TPR) repeat protein